MESSLTRVYREKQSTAHLDELVVEILPPNAGLNHNIHIVPVELNNLIHVGKINTDAPKGRRKVPLERAAARVPNDGNAVLVADPGNCADFFCASRIRHGHWQGIWVRGAPFRVAV